jgi:hypothetical protein
LNYIVSTCWWYTWFFWFLKNESIRGLSVQMLCYAFFHSSCWSIQPWLIFKKLITIQTKICQNSQHVNCIYHLSFQVFVMIICELVHTHTHTLSFKDFLIQFTYLENVYKKKKTHIVVPFRLVVIVMPILLEFNYPKHWKWKKLQILDAIILGNLRQLCNVGFI